MSREHICIDDRIAALEAKVAGLEKLIAAVDLTTEGVTFKSEGRTIIIAANAAGIWVEGKDKSIAALYSVPHEGAVVGVYGQPDKDGKRRGTLDACLFYDPRKGEASLQLTKADNTVYHLTPDETGEGLKLNFKPKA